jgi:hypothetical protein
MVNTLLLHVVYGSQNRQQFFPYTTLTGIYNRGGVFTVRYGLSPYNNDRFGL